MKWLVICAIIEHIQSVWRDEMRALLFLIVALALAIESNASTCEMIDEPGGYRYLECDPAKIKAAKEANRAAGKANEGKPEPKAGWQESVDEFAARMAVKNAKNEAERAAAQARADVVRREEDRKQAELGRKQAAAAAKAEAEFKQAAEAGRLGSWRYALKEDRMGGGQTKTAVTVSKNQVSFGFPYQGSQRATLLLRAHPRYGRDVMLSLFKSTIDSSQTRRRSRTCLLRPPSTKRAIASLSSM